MVVTRTESPISISSGVTLAARTSPRPAKRHRADGYRQTGECHDPTSVDGFGKRHACWKPDCNGCTGPRRWRRWPRWRRLWRWTHGRFWRGHIVDFGGHMGGFGGAQMEASQEVTWVTLAAAALVTSAASTSRAFAESISAMREVRSLVAGASTTTAMIVRTTRHTDTAGMATTAYTDVERRWFAYIA